MSKRCPTCGSVLKVKPIRQKPTEKAREDMTKDELYAYYKATAPIEDLRFFIRVTAHGTAREMIALLDVFDVHDRLTIPRAEFYRRFTAVQDAWRQDSLRGER